MRIYSIIKIGSTDTKPAAPAPKNEKDEKKGKK